MVLFGGLWSKKRRRHRRSERSVNGDEGGNDENKPIVSNGDNENYQSAAHTTDMDSSNNISDHSNSEEDDVPSLTQEFSNFLATNETLRLCLFYVSIYFLIGIVAYCYVFEQWSIIDALYFCVNTFTTCGYGDHQPTTVAGELFTIIFAIYGVIILGVFIGIIGHALSEAQSKAIDKFHTKNQSKVLKALFRKDSIGSKRKYLNSLLNQQNGQQQESLFSDHASLLDDIRDVVAEELPEIILLGILCLILGLREGWSIPSILYFCVMSATTTGYGEYTPQTQADKLYCVFLLPLSVSVFGEVLGRIASTYIERKQRQKEIKFIQQTLTLCDFRRMDINHDGQVSIEEFLSFLLVALGKVDEDFMEELCAVFHRIDTNDNGFIEKEELLALTCPVEGGSRPTSPV